MDKHITLNLNSSDWTVYPATDLDKLYVLYKKDRWRAIPLDMLIEHNIIRDTDTSIMYCSQTGGVVVTDNNLVKNKPSNILTDNSLILRECYVSSIDTILSCDRITDVEFLKYSQETNTKNGGGVNYVFGIRYESKNLSKNGVREIKTILYKKDLSSLMKYLERFSSAASEKSIVVIPTSESSWISVYPQSLIIDR